MKGMFGIVKTCPPSTISVAPVTYEDASLAKKMAAFAISLAVPDLCIGNSFQIYWTDPPTFNLSQPSVSFIGPGQIPLTRTPFGPSQTAKCLVRASTPALAVPAWDCHALPLQCREAVIFMIDPFFPSVKAYWFTNFDSRNVPKVSIIKTVLNPFGDKLSRGARKLPAAPLIKISICPCFQTTSLTVSQTSFQFLTSQELPHTKLFFVYCFNVYTALLMLFIFLLIIQTPAPCKRNYLAIPQHIPVAPPLMRAIFPFRIYLLKNIQLRFLFKNDVIVLLKNQLIRSIQLKMVSTIQAY